MKLVDYGYGQLELNLVAFPRTGRVVAQYKAGQSFIGATRNEDKPLENGMLLKVDGVNRCVDMAAPTKAGDIYALNYSTEHMYDERTYRLADFKLNPVDDFYPRLGYLDIGDKFTTNCVSYETEATSVAEAWVEVEKDFAKGLLGVPSANGYIELVAEVPETVVAGPVLRVIEITTMPDGQKAVKLEVIKA